MFFPKKIFKMFLLIAMFTVPALVAVGQQAPAWQDNNDEYVNRINIDNKITHIDGSSCTKSTWFATACAIAAGARIATGNTLLSMTIPPVILAVLYGWEWAVHGVNDTHKKNLAAIAAGLAVGNASAWAGRYGTKNALQWMHVIKPDMPEVINA